MNKLLYVAPVPINFKHLDGVPKKYYVKQAHYKTILMLTLYLIIMVRFSYIMSKKKV